MFLISNFDLPRKLLRITTFIFSNRKVRRVGMIAAIIMLSLSYPLASNAYIGSSFTSGKPNYEPKGNNLATWLVIILIELHLWVYL